MLITQAILSPSTRSRKRVPASSCLASPARNPGGPPAGRYICRMEGLEARAHHAARQRTERR